MNHILKNWDNFWVPHQIKYFNLNSKVFEDKYIKNFKIELVLDRTKYVNNLEFANLLTSKMIFQRNHLYSIETLRVNFRKRVQLIDEQLKTYD